MRLFENYKIIIDFCTKLFTVLYGMCKEKIVRRLSCFYDDRVAFTEKTLPKRSRPLNRGQFCPIQ